MPTRTVASTARDWRAADDFLRLARCHLARAERTLQGSEEATTTDRELLECCRNLIGLMAGLRNVIASLESRVDP